LRTILCRAALSALMFAALNAYGQGPGTGARPQQLFSTAPVKQLRKGADSWPVIIAPQTPAVRRTNTLLKAMNRTFLRELNECDRELQQYARATQNSLAANPAGNWDRKVAVKMEGPRFVSIVANETQVCSGSYPLNQSFALVFDMKTGSFIDWKAFVPDNQDIGVTSVTLDGVSVPQLVMPSLSSLAVSRADGECKQALEEESLSFLVWPDAKAGRLMVKATGLPHVVEACEEPIGLTIGEARKLGFSEALLNSLENAHQRAAHTF